ncbi:MAG TPA: hypothetical protein VI959_03280 [Alphaproteobacteria bacterium]|nr:hypothetical protein [Alphaproteobacteria bacterium]
MADQFDEFVQEVENDIRQEKLRDLWDKYGKIASSVIGGVLTIGVGITLWQNHQTDVSLKLSDTLIAVEEHLAQGKSQEAFVLLDQIVSKGNKVYSPIAEFEKAALLCSSPEDIKRQEGLSLYEALKNNKQLSPLYRQYAHIVLISHKLELPSADVVSLITEIEPLCAPTSHWKHLALELKALLLEKAGNTVQAREIFSELVRDDKAPQGISMRAQLMSQVLQTQAS